jgi:aspartate kinase
VTRAAAHDKVVVVVSAMGDTTDYLLKLGRQVSLAPNRREMDALLSSGEQISIALVAMAIQELGFPAVSLTGQQLGIITESVHTEARIVETKTERLESYLDNGTIVVAAGFQGITSTGDITTLGRGGSDTTAVALAAALGAQTCDIYTDVSGVYTADPNLVPSARLMSEISYEEMLEMSRVGAQVLHPRAVELARQHRILLRVRNTFDPQHTGTVLKEVAEMEVYRPVSGVTLDRDQARLAILKVSHTPGVAGQIFNALAERRISTDMIIQAFHQGRGITDISFTVKRGDLEAARSVLNEQVEQLKADSVLSDENVAKVSIIGAGLMDHPDIPARLFAALGRAGINIEMISTSDIRISCIIRDSDAERAINLIHDLFHCDESESESESRQAE